MPTPLLPMLQDAMKAGASDILIVSGSPLAFKINGRITHVGTEHLSPGDTEELIRAIYELDRQRSLDALLNSGDDDFSFSVSGLGRFRCSAYKQRSSLSAVLRIVSFSLPDADALHIPPAVLDLCGRQKGLILITGAAGSGKSTTLACMIDRINHTREGHVITLEDPIEFLHTHDRCIVSQREISHDTEGYEPALRAALRQAPDVILLGEMRDFETIRTVITAAETGSSCPPGTRSVPLRRSTGSSTFSRRTSSSRSGYSCPWSCRPSSPSSSSPPWTATSSPRLKSWSPPRPSAP